MNEVFNKDNEINYNFNPLLYLENYLELIYQDLQNKFNKHGLLIDLEKSGVTKMSQDQGYEVVFIFKKTKNYLTITYNTGGWNDTWITGDPNSDTVRFPKVDFSLCVPQQNSIRFNQGIYKLEQEHFLNFLVIFLKSKKFKNREDK